MKFLDLLSALFWLAISIFVTIESIRVRVGTVRFPGPGFLPFTVAIVLGVLAVILIIARTLPREQEDASNLWQGIKWGRPVWVLISLFLYALLLPTLGYLIATSALMMFLFNIVEKERIWIGIIWGLAVVVISYLFFHVWLNVQLPSGVLEFS